MGFGRAALDGACYCTEHGFVQQETPKIIDVSHLLLYCTVKYVVLSSNVLMEYTHYYFSKDDTKVLDTTYFKQLFDSIVLSKYKDV